MGLAYGPWVLPVKTKLATTFQTNRRDIRMATHSQYDYSRYCLSELAGQLAESYQAVTAAVIKPQLRVEGHRELLAQMLVNLIEKRRQSQPTRC